MSFASVYLQRLLLFLAFVLVRLGFVYKSTFAVLARRMALSSFFTSRFRVLSSRTQETRRRRAVLLATLHGKDIGLFLPDHPIAIHEQPSHTLAPQLAFFRQ